MFCQWSHTYPFSAPIPSRLRAAANAIFRITATARPRQDSIPSDTGVGVYGDFGLQCAPGTTAATADGWPPCAPCPPGTASATPGGTACAACASGTFAAGAASACDACPPGTFVDAAGASACAPCPPPLDSPLRRPDRRNACVAACGAEVCLATPPPTTTARATLARTNTTPAATTSAPAWGGGLSTTTRAATTAADHPSSTPPPRRNVCGNGEREERATACWTGDRGGMRACVDPEAVGRWES